MKAGIRARSEEAAKRLAPGPLVSTASSSFLIFEDDWNGHRRERMALPLSVVVRIESVSIGQVEYAGDRPLLQYRGDLLPLEDRGGVLRELSEGDEDATATVLICQKPGRGSQKIAWWCGAWSRWHQEI